MTSLRDQDLDDRIEFLPDFRKRLLPVSPTPKHPDHGIQLQLRDGHEMKYKSYVNTHEIFKLKFDHLRRFSDGVRVFTQKSLQTLIQKSGFVQTFHPGSIFSMQQLSLFDTSVPAEQTLRKTFHVPRVLFPQSRTAEEMKSMRRPLSIEESEGILEKLREVDLCGQ